MEKTAESPIPTGCYKCDRTVYWSGNCRSTLPRTFTPTPTFLRMLNRDLIVRPAEQGILPRVIDRVRRSPGRSPEAMSKLNPQLLLSDSGIVYVLRQSLAEFQDTLDLPWFGSFWISPGLRTSCGGKPLHWMSRLKIAEDLATGLLYIHQSHGLAHGNLKSSNVLLGSDFESCLTDYGLTYFRDTESYEEPRAASLFYRVPECRDPRRPVTQQADIYSFGVLLLELLTGETPFQDPVQEHWSDIPRGAKSIREEVTESGEDPATSNEASEEKLQAMLNIAMAIVCLVPEIRPTAREVLKMVRDARSEVQVSSNSSEHSPGR